MLPRGFMLGNGWRGQEKHARQGHALNFKFLLMAGDWGEKVPGKAGKK